MTYSIAPLSCGWESIFAVLAPKVTCPAFSSTLRGSSSWASRSIRIAGNGSAIQILLRTTLMISRHRDLCRWTPSCYRRCRLVDLEEVAQPHGHHEGDDHVESAPLPGEIPPGRREAGRELDLHRQELIVGGGCGVERRHRLGRTSAALGHRKGNGVRLLLVPDRHRSVRF